MQTETQYCHCEEEEDARDRFMREMREKRELEKSMEYCANLQRFKFKNDWEYELNEFIESLTPVDLENVQSCNCIHEVFDSFSVDDEHSDEYKIYMYMNLLCQSNTDKEHMLNDICKKVNEKLEN
jgi:hypothetical protein